MKRTQLFAAVAIVLAANSFALLHAWENRRQVDADIVLTERELGQPYNSSADDSGIGLSLRWNRIPADSLPPWLDVRRLQNLGFDTTVSPTDRGASEFYSRQRTRRAFVALEYNGPAWRQWLESPEIQATMSKSMEIQREGAPRLIAIDADIDAVRLRARHPNPGSVIVVPAAVGIEVESFNQMPAGARPAPRLEGSIEEIPASIHLPLAFSQGFRNLPRDGSAKYRVHLRYGASLEPWIVGVEFIPATVQ